VHRYNAEGLAGLASRRGSGRPRQLTPEQMAELAGWVEAGSDLAPIWPRPGSGRRGAPAAQGPLPRRIEAAVGVALHERTVGKQLAASNWRQATGGKQLAASNWRHSAFGGCRCCLKAVRPQHPKSDATAQDAFKKTSRRR